MIKNAYLSLRDHLRVPLFANAYALIANQVLTAGLGFAFWIVAARLYSVEIVGNSSAILSTVLFLSALAELSFKAAATRFVPRAGKNTQKLLLGAIGINLVAALITGTFIITIGRHFSLTKELLEGVNFWPGWLVLAGMVTCIFVVQDGVLTGFRQAKWVAIKNTIYSIIKIVLLIICFRFVASYGILISWFLPVAFFGLFFYILIFWWLLPRTSFGEASHIKPITAQEVIQSISADYFGSILLEACIRMMPLIVLQQLGERDTAFYYQAWVIANPVYLVVSSMTTSFAVEASTNLKEISQISRKILRQAVLLIVPAAMVVLLGAYWVMYMFGRDYAQGSSGLLRWLMLATLPIIVNYWYLNFSRVTGSIKGIILLQGLTSVLAVAASFLLIPIYGITGVGIAWFSAQTLIAIPVLIKTAPTLLNRHKENAFGEHAQQNRTLRRVDWRFLFSLDSREKAIYLSPDKEMRCGLSTFITSIDENPSLDKIPDHDLAVLINPAQNKLRVAASSLKAGGLAYAEFSAWRMWGKYGILRRMRAAGFSSVKMYAPFPSPIYPRIWIPLSAFDGAINYIAKWLFPDSGWMHRFGRFGVKLLLPITLRTGLLPSISAVGAKEGSQDWDTFSRVQVELSKSFPEISAHQLSFLMQSPGTLSENKIVILVFLDGEDQPKWVVKIPRLWDGVISLKAEADLLLELRQSVQIKEASLLVPEPVFQFDFNGIQCFSQTAMTGIPLQHTLHSGNLREIALQLTDWQIALACVSREWKNDNSIEQFIEKLLVKIESELSNHEDIVKIISKTRRILSKLRDIPFICVHNDFTVWNARRTDNGLAVFDWTDAYRSGPPLLDLVYGISSAAILLEKAWDSSERSPIIYQKLLDTSTTTGAIFNECIELYAKQVGLQAEQIAPLRLLTWVLNVSFDLQFRRFEMGSIPQPYKSMYFSLWLTELDAQYAVRLSSFATGMANSLSI